MWSLIATIKTFYIFYSIIIAEEALEWRHCPADWTKQEDLITHQQPASAEAPLWCEMEAATVTILMLFDHRSLVCGLLRATPVPPTKHLHKKQFNWTIALCLISLSELHWCKPGSSGGGGSHTVIPVFRCTDTCRWYTQHFPFIQSHQLQSEPLICYHESTRQVALTCEHSTRHAAFSFSHWAPPFWPGPRKQQQLKITWDYHEWDTITVSRWQQVDSSTRLAWSCLR